MVRLVISIDRRSCQPIARMSSGLIVRRDQKLGRKGKGAVLGFLAAKKNALDTKLNFSTSNFDHPLHRIYGNPSTGAGIFSRLSTFPVAGNCRTRLAV